MPQQPGDVVDKDVRRAKNDGWPDNRVGQTGIDNRLFQDRLTAKVGKTRSFRRICDTNMYDALHTGLLSGFDQYFRVLNCPIEGNRAMRKANPVGIIEGSCSLQAHDQFLRFVEVEREYAHLVPERVWVIGMSCERTDCFPHCQQPACNIFARIAESPGDYVDFAIRHSSLCPYCCISACIIARKVQGKSSMLFVTIVSMMRK